MDYTQLMCLGMGLQQTIREKKILITVGSGGVGKTTISAALGLLAARSGRQTLVMTIDPAQRLASSLGLAQLDHREREIAAEAHGIAPGRMQAMMLGSKNTLDAWLERYAPDAQTKEKLRLNRLYQQISTRLAGSQEYAAVAQLLESYQSKRHDLIVLDTPPTTNALDFLDAPEKMVNAIESSALNLFRQPFRAAGRRRSNRLAFRAAYVMRRLARFTGQDFLNDIADFLNELSGMLGVIHQHAAQTSALLRQKEVGFVIVASPDWRAINEASELYHRLTESAMMPVAFVFNRVHPQLKNELSVAQVPARLLAHGVEKTVAGPLAEVLLASHQRLQALAQADEARIASLKAHCGAHLDYLRVPLLKNDVHDIPGLFGLAQHLLPKGTSKET
jgi:anion-transporting  ArsA/GET3 family ATPase